MTEKEFISYLLTFAKIAGVWMVISVATDYFTSHWTFRWRTAMADYYHENWSKARLTEGASQRVQEDTLKFARIMEGSVLIARIMTLLLSPILWAYQNK